MSILSSRPKKFRRDNAKIQRASIPRRGFLASFGMMLAPTKPVGVTGSVVMHGFIVQIVVVPPGVPAPEAEPGRARTLVEMENGWTLVYLSQGPTDEHRDRMESLWNRTGVRFGQPPLDWAELEADLFGPDAVAG